VGGQSSSRISGGRLREPTSCEGSQQPKSGDPRGSQTSREVQTAKRELNGGARDACKIMAATPRTAMVGKAVTSTDQTCVSVLLF
jgi:hypothetical protein